MLKYIIKDVTAFVSNRFIKQIYKFFLLFHFPFIMNFKRTLTKENTAFYERHFDFPYFNIAIKFLYETV